MLRDETTTIINNSSRLPINGPRNPVLTTITDHLFRVETRLKKVIPSSVRFGPSYPAIRFAKRIEWSIILAGDQLIFRTLSTMVIIKGINRWCRYRAKVILVSWRGRKRERERNDGRVGVYRFLDSFECRACK